MNGAFLGALFVVVVIVMIVIVVVIYVKRKQARKSHSSKVSRFALSETDNAKVTPRPLPSKTNIAPTPKTTPVMPSPINAIDGHEKELYQSLLRKALGDKAKVERLIQLEAKKTPQANRIEWLRNAIDQWERDRR
jgi:hypothetical protein